MSERTKDNEIVLSELPRKMLTSVNYEVKVPNFFTLPEYDETEIEMNSPPFEFAETNWQLDFKSRGKYKNEADEWVKRFLVSLERLNSEERELTIFYTILLLDANDTKYCEFRRANIYSKSSPCDDMCCFYNNKLSYDRRDTLTLVINLISEEPPKVNTVQEPHPYAGITERRKGCKITLSELPKNTPASVSFRIKLTSFFTPKEHKGIKCKINSKSFKFANATWSFLFESLAILDNVAFFYFYLRRLNSEVREHSIFSTILSLNEDDEICNERRYVNVYDEDTKDETKLMTYFGEVKNNSHLIIHLICNVEPPRTKREITDETNNFKVSLSELPRKRLSSVNYEMKVPNFFTLPEYDNSEFKIYGPSFQFAKATWQYIFEPKAGKPKKEFNVSLMRVNSEVPKHSITYIMSLLNGNDENDDECRNGHVYDEAVSHHRMCTFSNSKLPYDRRDTLTLRVHLISDESSDINEIQETPTTTRGRYLRQDFKDVLLDGENHNITFSVQGKEFRAHQDILKARSEVFRSMLTHDMLEKNSGSINVADCNPEAFEQLLLYIYTGNVESLDENNMFGLYYAADKYGMSFLKEECSEFIKNSLSVSNVCEVIDLASKHSDRNLLDCATKYFTTYADDIFLTVKWQLFLKENPTVANELIIKSFKRLKLQISS